MSAGLPPFADSMVDLAGAAMLLLGLLLPVQRRCGAAARLAAWQGGFLALAAAVAAWNGGGNGLWLVAVVAAAGRAARLPALLRLATTSIGGGGDADAPSRAVGASVSRAGSAAPAGPGTVATLLAGTGLAVLAAAAVAATGAGVEVGTREGLALALATLLAGLLAMLGRRRGGGVAFGLLGLVAAENGALLGLVHAGGTPGAAAAFAALSPGLVACVSLAALRGGGALRAAMPWAPRR